MTGIQTNATPHVEDISPKHVGIHGGVPMTLHGRELFPRSTTVLVRDRPCDVLHDLSDAHGESLVCMLPSVEEQGRYAVRLLVDGVPMGVENSITYQDHLVPHSGTKESHLSGVPGDFLHILPSDNWSLLESPREQIKILVGGRRSQLGDSHDVIFPSSIEEPDELRSSRSFMVKVPFGLEAGKYPLSMSIDRSHFRDSHAHGQVRFDQDYSKNVTLEVIPSITGFDVNQGKDGSLHVSVYGQGFSLQKKGNWVKIGDLGCIVLVSDYHYIDCLAHRNQMKSSAHFHTLANMPAAKRSASSVHRGFQLDISSLKSHAGNMCCTDSAICSLSQCHHGQVCVRHAVQSGIHAKF